MLLADPVARVYAEALFGLARATSRVDDIGEEIEGFAALMRDDREIGVFLTSPVLDASEKIGRLKTALSGRMDDTVTDFLCLLVEKRRIGALPAIVAAYRSMADEHAGRVRVHVRSAAPLPDPLRGEIGAMLRDVLSREVVLETEADAGLMGGAVVAIGDRVYDGSIRGRLDRFRKQMMRSRGYEDQG